MKEIVVLSIVGIDDKLSSRIMYRDEIKESHYSFQSFKNKNDSQNRPYFYHYSIFTCSYERIYHS